MFEEARGSQDKLLEQINKKLAKEKTIEQIADDLVETVETIQKLLFI